MSHDIDATKRSIIRTLGADDRPLTQSERAQAVEVLALVDSIEGTWSGGPSSIVWAEELTLLEPGRAGTAFARLRRECDRAPSIAKFLATYRAICPPPASPVERDCSCSGSGWVDAPPLVVDGWTYSQDEPCGSCAAGEQARRVHERIARSRELTT